jgi:PAS domain S-box-containing protein
LSPSGPLPKDASGPSRGGATPALVEAEAERCDFPDPLLDIDLDRSSALGICELAAAICDAPSAGVRLTVGEGGHEEVWHGPDPEIALADAPCSTVIASAEPLAIEDLREDPGPDGEGWRCGRLRAYAGVPIRTEAGVTLGVVCVLDSIPRAFDRAEMASLATLASQVAGGLELLRLARSAALADRRRDVAEEQAAQSMERFHALVEASPLAIFALDPMGRPDFVSEGCAVLFGARGPDYDADGWIPALHEEDHDRAIREWGDATRTRSSLDTQYRIYDAEGKVRELIVNAAAMHAAGEFRGWVGTITDVTEQVEINRALARSRRASEQARVDLESRNQELQALARSRDLVLAAISHEFRTPLTSITTFLQLLDAEDDLSGSQQQAVAVIARNTARLDQLVSDLLSAKQAPAEIEVHLQPVDLHAAAAEAVAAAILRAREQAVELLIEEPAAEVLGWADPKRVAQVLDSLLDNALKYTPGGGRIVVRVRLAGKHAEIEVGDSGVGIAVEELGRIFDSFYQGRAGRESGRGSGLGLSIVVRILDAQDAAIDVRSKVGAGTKMTISFPRSAGG